MAMAERLKTERLREHLEVLNDVVLTAWKSKPKKGAADSDAIQDLKILMDLVQERNATLDRIAVRVSLSTAGDRVAEAGSLRSSGRWRTA
jgi:hypothetical protein